MTDQTPGKIELPCPECARRDVLLERARAALAELEGKLAEEHGMAVYYQTQIRHANEELATEREARQKAERRVAELENLTHTPVGTLWKECAENRFKYLQEARQRAEQAEARAVRLFDRGVDIGRRLEQADARNAELTRSLNEQIHKTSEALDALSGYKHQHAEPTGRSQCPHCRAGIGMSAAPGIHLTGFQGGVKCEDPVVEVRTSRIAELTERVKVLEGALREIGKQLPDAWLKLSGQFDGTLEVIDVPVELSEFILAALNPPAKGAEE